MDFEKLCSARRAIKNLSILIENWIRMLEIEMSTVLDIPAEKEIIIAGIEAYRKAVKSLKDLHDINDELQSLLLELCCRLESLDAEVRKADVLEAPQPALLQIIDFPFCTNKPENEPKPSACVLAGQTSVLAGQINQSQLAGGNTIYCRNCGSILFSQARFCPFCGNQVPKDVSSVGLQKVQFSAIAPKVLTEGKYSIVRVIMYEESCRYIVDEMMRVMGEYGPAQEQKSGIHRVSDGAKIKILLTSPDLMIEDNIETGTWRGDYLAFAFSVSLPENYNKQQVLFIAVVYINDLIATRLKFVADISSGSEQNPKIVRNDVSSAFMSYASQDRSRVAAIVQGMKKARPDMDVFFDVESLRSGDDWERTIHYEINRRDVLFLCWSRFARESEWVNEEWRYAFTTKGIDGIEPVPIEPPDICPPPEELRKKHFNDRLLYIIDDSAERGSGRKTVASLPLSTETRPINIRFRVLATGELFESAEKTLIMGRDQSRSDFLWHQRYISRCHCAINRYSASEYSVIDYHSNNHTYIKKPGEARKSLQPGVEQIVPIGTLVRLGTCESEIELLL